MATIDIATLATELSTDARTTRKFLRSITPADAQPGKGSRWAIEKREVRSLRAKFAKFTADAADAKLASTPKTSTPKSTPDALEVAHDTFDDIEPTDAELDAIETD